MPDNNIRKHFFACFAMLGEVLEFQADEKNRSIWSCGHSQHVLCISDGQQKSNTVNFLNMQSCDGWIQMD